LHFLQYRQPHFHIFIVRIKQSHIFPTVSDSDMDVGWIHPWVGLGWVGWVYLRTW